MATIDGLAISSGSNRGEAAFLGESNFDPVALAGHLADREFAVRQRAKQEEDAKMKELALRFSKLPDDYWDRDAKDIMKEKDDFKAFAIQNFKDYKGRLPFEKQVEQERVLSNLERKAAQSNEQGKEFKTVFTEVSKNPEKYTPESLKSIEIFQNPDNFKDEKIVNSKGEVVIVGEELKNAGDKYQFRAANSHLLHLDEQYNLIDRSKSLNALIPDAITSIEQAASMAGSKGTKTIKEKKPSKEYADIIANQEIEKYGKKVYGEIDKLFFDKMNDNQKEAFTKLALKKAKLVKDNGEFTESVLSLPDNQRLDTIKKALYSEALSNFLVAGKSREYGESFAFAPVSNKSGNGEKKQIKLVTGTKPLQQTTEQGSFKPAFDKVGVVTFSDIKDSENSYLDFSPSYYLDKNGKRVNNTNNEIIVGRTSEIEQRYVDGKRIPFFKVNRMVKTDMGTQYETAWLPYDEVKPKIISEYSERGITEEKLDNAVREAARKVVKGTPIAKPKSDPLGLFK